MRKIEAIIRSDRIDALRHALLHAGILNMTVTEVREYGNYKAHTEIYRSDTFSIDALASVKVETIVPQKKVPITVAILKSKGQAGTEGAERIFISSVNEVSRIFSNEPGESV